MQLVEQECAVAAQRRIPIVCVDDSDGVTAETGVSVSGSEIQVSKNGGAFANFAGGLTEVGGGVYYYTPTTSELDTIGVLIVQLVKSGILAFRAVVQVVPYDPYYDPLATRQAALGMIQKTVSSGEVKVLGKDENPASPLATVNYSQPDDDTILAAET